MEDKSVDLVLTDPPYVGISGGLDVRLNRGVGKLINTSKTVGERWGTNIGPYLKEAYRVSRLGMLVFCSFAGVAKIEEMVGVSGISLVVWYKSNAMPSMNNVPQYEVEFIWAFKRDVGLDWRKLRGMYDIQFLQAGCIANPERLLDRRGKVLHPTQKPLALMLQLLQIGGETVYDPFLGSGTTAVACEKLGRKWIGSEINPDYCKIAEKRPRDFRSQGVLFEPGT
jgi:DNA modification methylase